MKVDALGHLLLQRIQELLNARPDLTREDFFRAIGRPTPSWRSEFWAAKRTTNDLRLLLKIAKFFGVPVGYLIGESAHPRDPLLQSLIGVWPDLPQREKETLMLLAARAKALGDPARGDTGSGPHDPGGSNGPPVNGPRSRKRR